MGCVTGFVFIGHGWMAGLLARAIPLECLDHDHCDLHLDAASSHEWHCAVRILSVCKELVEG